MTRSPLLSPAIQRLTSVLQRARGEHASGTPPWTQSSCSVIIQIIMAQALRSVTLLARSQARSDDVEATSFEQPLVAPAIHPFTGTFAASEHTVAFGSKAFRIAFPLHVAALALLLFVLCVSTSGMEYLFILLPLGLLGARIAMHRWDCRARAQRFGAIAWTITVACGCTSDFVTYCLDPKALCKSAGDLYTYPMTSILLALINASHGMEFWHTASLAGLLLCDLIAVRIICADSAPVNLAIVALVVTFGAGHFAQLVARRTFLRFEHIQTSRDRLEHDFQRLEYRLSGSSSARLPTVVTPTESSTCGWTTISAAPQQKFSSAPERVLIEWPPPHATHPSTAGSSSAGSSTAADYLSDSVPLYSVTSNLSESVPLYSVSRRQPSPLERPGDL